MSNNRYFHEPEVVRGQGHGNPSYYPYDPAFHRPDQVPHPAPQQGGYRIYADPAYPPMPGQHVHTPYPGTSGRGAAPDPQTGQPGAPISVIGVTHAFGAVLSVALIVGALGWAWQMMKRDVAGVPVVRALEGPLRVAPETPGGRQAAHQGLSVNEIAAAHEDGMPDEIVLAPAPFELPSEDLIPIQPPQELRPAVMLAEQAEPIPVALTQELQLDATASALGMRDPSLRAVAASPRPPVRDEARLSQARVAALQAPATGALSGDDLAATLANSVALGLSSVRDIDVDPATIGPGTRLVQLGAYDDIATAREAWDQLARRFAPLLDDRGRVIEAAHSGGSVFYRLRAHGFTDERDARRFCAALVDQQIDCIPVLIR